MARLLVTHSEWDHNKDGFDTNSQNSADAPSPQNGACPKGVKGPTGTTSCWVFEHNYVHDNNNPNVPTSATLRSARWELACRSPGAATTRLCTTGSCTTAPGAC